MEKNKYPIGGFAPGYYHCKCFVCAERFQGDKRATMCEPCAIELTARPKEVEQVKGEEQLLISSFFKKFSLEDRKKFYYGCGIELDDQFLNHSIETTILNRIIEKGFIQSIRTVVNQPVQQEEQELTQEESYIEWLKLYGFPSDPNYDRGLHGHAYIHQKKYHYMREFEEQTKKQQDVQPSTPIVEEQNHIPQVEKLVVEEQREDKVICSINCKCESGEDCDGESALNLIDLVEQQDRIAEIVEFVKSNLNTREEEVINIISDTYRITPIKNENI